MSDHGFSSDPVTSKPEKPERSDRLWKICVLLLVAGLAFSVLLTFTAAQSSPADASSRPTLSLPVQTAGGAWRLTWTSQAGRTYRLERTTDLSTGAAGWTTIATIVATSSTSQADDSSPPATSRFYRVILVQDVPDTSAPVVSAIRASPTLAQSEGIVVLEVNAQDGRGVASVAVFDGATELGPAIRLEGDAWRYFWSVSFAQNGLHHLTAQALNLPGHSASSPDLAFTVAIAKAQSSQTVGAVSVRADSFQTNGTVSVLSGNVRLGSVTLSAGSSLSIDAARGQISGRGKVNVPGLDQVFDGAFVVDSITGWLTANTGPGPASLVGAPTFSPIRLNSRTVLTPRELSVNVFTSALRGKGVAEMQISNQNLNPARLDGSFTYDSTSFVLTLDGAFSLGSVSGNGLFVVRLSDSTFLLTGNLSFAARAGGPTALSSATLELTFNASGTPNFAVTGKHLLVNNQTEDVRGSLNADGSPNLINTPSSTPAFIRDDPERFAPLGPDGNPLNGFAVQARADGSLPPLEYRPAGRSVLGRGQHFFIRFPGGVRLVESGGDEFFEFVQAIAGFGETFPLQFSEPVQRLAGPVKRLTLGPLSLTDLAALFDRDPAEGLPVRVFDRLPLLWKDGVLADGGIRGARFALANTGLPLPGMSGDYPDFVIDFNGRDGIRIPVSGEFELPDGSSTPGQLSIPKNRPAWLGVRPDGQFFLLGRVEVEFPNQGPKFSADITLDDPFYQLQMVAQGVHLPLLGSLVDLLPGSPNACLPNTATPDGRAQASVRAPVRVRPE